MIDKKIDYKQAVTEFVEAQKVVNAKHVYMQDLAIKQFQIMHDLETLMNFDSTSSDCIDIYWESRIDWKFEVRDYTKFPDRLFCIGFNEHRDVVCNFWLDEDIISGDADTFRVNYSESLEALTKKRETSQKKAVKRANAKRLKELQTEIKRLQQQMEGN
jgi:hypothetical protein